MFRGLAFKRALTHPGARAQAPRPLPPRGARRRPTAEPARVCKWRPKPRPRVASHPPPGLRKRFQGKASRRVCSVKPQADPRLRDPAGARPRLRTPGPSRAGPAPQRPLLRPGRDAGAPAAPRAREREGGGGSRRVRGHAPLDGRARARPSTRGGPRPSPTPERR